MLMIKDLENELKKVQPVKSKWQRDEIEGFTQDSILMAIKKRTDEIIEEHKLRDRLWVSVDRARVLIRYRSSEWKRNYIEIKVTKTLLPRTWRDNSNYYTLKDVTILTEFETMEDFIKKFDEIYKSMRENELAKAKSFKQDLKALGITCKQFKALYEIYDNMSYNVKNIIMEDK